MSDDDYTSNCRGRDNYSDHCLQNGPSKAVWMEIILAGCIIFGLFFCYVKWSSKRRKQDHWIEWNDDYYSNDNSQPYYHMHPDANKPRRDGRKQDGWISRISSKSLGADLTAVFYGEQDHQKEPSQESKQGEEEVPAELNKASSSESMQVELGNQQKKGDEWVELPSAAAVEELTRNNSGVLT